jgi:hypothetical protein
MAEILWHRRETRRQTEKTNFSLKPREAPVYSTEATSQCWSDGKEVAIPLEIQFVVQRV